MFRSVVGITTGIRLIVSGKYWKDEVNFSKMCLDLEA